MYTSNLLHQLWKKHKLEIISLLLSTLFICIAAYILYGLQTLSNDTTVTVEKVHASEKKAIVDKLSNEIAVEVSGSVVNPDVYIIKTGSRIKDVIQKAGGLSYRADTNYVARNFNMSLFVTDHQKIHVPSFEEIDSGIFPEDPRKLTYLQENGQPGIQTSTKPENSSKQAGKTNINTASLQELNALPGIGDISAQKIIENRPYTSIKDLVDKKVITTKVSEQIAELISY